MTFTAEAVAALCEQAWPGNVRELRNVLEHAVIVSEGEVVLREHLPSGFGKPAPAGRSALAGLRFPAGATADEVERELILQTLESTGNNKTRAAEILGVSLKTLHNKLKEYEAGAKGHATPPED